MTRAMRGIHIPYQTEMRESSIDAPCPATILRSDLEGASEAQGRGSQKVLGARMPRRHLWLFCVISMVSPELRRATVACAWISLPAIRCRSCGCDCLSASSRCTAQSPPEKRPLAGETGPSKAPLRLDTQIRSPKYADRRAPGPNLTANTLSGRLPLRKNTPHRPKTQTQRHS